MIKLFRKIRQNLLNEGKTTRYFKYAIGEIILVVIGILIALQVSNWNELRKTKIKTEALLDKFEDELELTVKNANFDISNSIVGDSIIKRVLKNEVTREDYIKNERLLHLLTWRFTLNPELDNLEKIIDKEETLDQKFDDILFDIDRFSFTREREVDAMNVLRISAEENTDFINLNFPWARQSDSIFKEQSYHYFLTDENYKNRLYTHWVKCMNYTSNISTYRTELLRILTKLKMVRENYTPEELKKYLDSLDQKPFKKINSDQDLKYLVTNNQIAKCSLIMNLSKDTLELKNKDSKGDVRYTRMLIPGIVYNTRGIPLSLDEDYLKIFEIYKKGELIDTYKEVQYGYLILE